MRQVAHLLGHLGIGPSGGVGDTEMLDQPGHERRPPRGPPLLAPVQFAADAASTASCEQRTRKARAATSISFSVPSRATSDVVIGPTGSSEGGEVGGVGEAGDVGGVGRDRVAGAVHR